VNYSEDCRPELQCERGSHAEVTGRYFAWVRFSQEDRSYFGLEERMGLSLSHGSGRFEVRAFGIEVGNNHLVAVCGEGEDV